jgi:uncharacterized C2H2 Zn-finger protein
MEIFGLLNGALFFRCSRCGQLFALINREASKRSNRVTFHLNRATGKPCGRVRLPKNKRVK